MKNSKFIFGSLLALLLSTSSTHALANPQNVYVNPAWAASAAGSDPDGYGPVTALGIDGFSTIQEAVNAVEVGGTVWLGEASYSGQVLIEKSLTLNGMGNASVLHFSPSTPRVEFTTSVVNVPVILVQNASNVRIQDLTIDGDSLGNENSRFMGIAFYNASGSIDEVRVRNIQNTPLDGTQQGLGIYVRNTGESEQQIRISRSSIYNYQKGGIVVVGAHLQANIFENTVEGAGATPALAQNGIQVGFGASGNIHNNRVTGNDCSAEICRGDAAQASTDMASGILLYYASTGTRVAQNEIERNQCGVCSVGTPDLRIVENSIVNGSSVGVNILEADTYSAAFGYGEASSNVVLSSNEIIGHDYGVLVYNFIEGGALPQLRARNNTINSQTVCPLWTNMTISEGRASIDARNNNWADGVSPLTRDYSADCLEGLAAINLGR